METKKEITGRIVNVNLHQGGLSTVVVEDHQNNRVIAELPGTVTRINGAVSTREGFHIPFSAIDLGARARIREVTQKIGGKIVHRTLLIIPPVERTNISGRRPYRY